MATKSGRVQFKDIRTGKTFWRVPASFEPGMSRVHADVPRSVRVLEKPFRTFLSERAFPVGSACVPEWSFTVMDSIDYDGSLRNTAYVLDCHAFGIETDVTDKRPDPSFGLSFLFTTEAHARRYYHRITSYRLADAFEHPRQLKATGHHYKTLGLPKHLRPYQRVVGGVVVDHTTPKGHVEYYMEQSRRELGMLYPFEIKPLKIDPEAFKQPDPKTFYPGIILGIDAVKDNVEGTAIVRMHTEFKENTHGFELNLTQDMSDKEGVRFVPSSKVARAEISNDDVGYLILPEKVDLRDCLPSVEDQDDLGSSSSSALGAALEMVPCTGNIPIVTEVIIGNGNKIHSQWTHGPVEDLPPDPPSAEVLEFVEELMSITILPADTVRADGIPWVEDRDIY